MEHFPLKDKDFYLKRDKLLTNKYWRSEERTEFRKYLDTTGVSDKLTEILLELYENPIVDFPAAEYLRRKLVEPNSDELEIAKLRTKLNEAKIFRDYLLRENKSLKERIEKNDRLMADNRSEELSYQSLSCSSIKNKKK